VVSPVGACHDIAEANRTHFVARTEEEWYEHLSQLLSDADLRRRMGDAGRGYAVQHYSIEAHVQKLADALRSAETTQSHCIR
ncbi:MAG TPA: glycosyltransferase, partial [Pyrinomonadaceae bacterium]|nr:glycosyltransferase [Pyrinomonadaceae bacterium]